MAGLLREQRAQGIGRRRVRVLRTPLGDYDRYACEWGYAYNVPLATTPAS